MRGGSARRARGGGLLGTLLACLRCLPLARADPCEGPDGSEGAAFLARCAGEQVQEASAPCLAAAESLFPEAAGPGGPRCAACPEACALALAMGATNQEAPADTPACAVLLAPFPRASDYLAQVAQPVAITAQEVRDLMDVRRMQCAALRAAELEELQLPPREPERRAPRIAVLLAANAEALARYQPFVNLWRCYALRHGLGFILDTDDSEAEAHTI